MGWIFINLFKTSVIQADEYQERANSNQFKSSTIKAGRGSIYDANGQIIAQSATVFNVILDPSNYRKKGYDQAEKKELQDKLADKLNELFGVDKETFLKKTQIEGGGSGYQVLAKKAEKPEADKLTQFCEENGISAGAVYVEEDTKRYYPQDDMAAPVIGFLNGDGEGQYGIEKYYNEYLAGTDGKIVSAKNGVGEEMPYRYEKTYDAQNGDSLYLTLDMTLQHYLEKSLKTCVSTHNPENRACGIIMNAKTGAVLAMATVPGFNLNEPANVYDPAAAQALEIVRQEQGDEEYTKQRAIAWEKQWKNKAISELYHPGSVFKVITGSSAIEEKAIDPKTSLFGCNRSIIVSGTKFGCWANYAHGMQDFVQAMTNSCNPAFVQIGLTLGKDKFVDYYESYGFGEATGIDLPGEQQSAIYYTADRMGDVELASSAFGQSHKVTPLQMITAYAAVVNGGNLVTPYVVSKIVDDNGNVIKTTEPVIKRQVISEETSAVMRDTLEKVVIGKNGSNAYIQGYRIGGKSGTSQKQEENNAEHREDLYVSSYVGFAPANDPEIIMLVMVDRPTGKDYYGSVVAVPVVQEVFKEALPYLGYYPEYTAEELAEMDITLPGFEGLNIEAAKNKLTSTDGIEYEIVGSGNTVLKQVPEKGAAMPRNGKVILYTDSEETENTTVPNVTGYSLSDVNAMLAAQGLNFKATGPSKREGAKASMQNWPYGSEVPKGTIIEVTFAIYDQSG